MSEEKQPKMTQSDIIAMAEAQKIASEMNDKAMEVLEEYFEKVISEPLEDEELKGKQDSLTRGEKKQFTKAKLNIKDYQFMTGEYDDHLDMLIKIRDIKGADKMKESHLALWLDKVLLKTLRPLDFEGK